MFFHLQIFHIRICCNTLLFHTWNNVQKWFSLAFSSLFFFTSVRSSIQHISMANQLSGELIEKCSFFFCLTISRFYRRSFDNIQEHHRWSWHRRYSDCFCNSSNIFSRGVIVDNTRMVCIIRVTATVQLVSVDRQPVLNWVKSRTSKRLIGLV